MMLKKRGYERITADGCHCHYHFAGRSQNVRVETAGNFRRRELEIGTMVGSMGRGLQLCALSLNRLRASRQNCRCIWWCAQAPPLEYVRAFVHEYQLVSVHRSISPIALPPS